MLDWVDVYLAPSLCSMRCKGPLSIGWAAAWLPSLWKSIMFPSHEQMRGCLAAQIERVCLTFRRGVFFRSLYETRVCMKDREKRRHQQRIDTANLDRPFAFICFDRCHHLCLLPEHRACWRYGTRGGWSSRREKAQLQLPCQCHPMLLFRRLWGSDWPRSFHWLMVPLCRLVTVYLLFGIRQRLWWRFFWRSPFGFWLASQQTNPPFVLNDVDVLFYNLNRRLLRLGSSSLSKWNTFEFTYWKKGCYWNWSVIALATSFWCVTDIRWIVKWVHTPPLWQVFQAYAHLHRYFSLPKVCSVLGGNITCLRFDS